MNKVQEVDGTKVPIKRSEISIKRTSPGQSRAKTNCEFKVAYYVYCKSERAMEVWNHLDRLYNI